VHLSFKYGNKRKTNYKLRTNKNKHKHIGKQRETNRQEKQNEKKGRGVMRVSLLFS